MSTISWERKRKSNRIISHLPDEIIEGILVRLPLKSFIRFQCVSKSWFNLMKNSSLIFNPLIKNDLSFIALCFIHKPKHLDSWFLNVFLFDDDFEDSKLSKRLSRFRKGVRSWIDDVLCDNREPDSKYPLPAFNFELGLSSEDSDFRVGLEFVGYCNGVMCLTDYDFILLVNPILKEVKKVSNPIKPSLIGFGFDDTSMDFKVVRIRVLVVGDRIEDGVREFEAEVYDVKKNAWRELGVYPLGFYNRVTCSTFFNGVIHWCVEINTRCWRILTFNVATELFQLMEFPQGWQGVNEYTPRIGLFVLDQDSLAFVDYSIIDSTPTVNVWIMNKKNVTRKSWICLHSIRDVPQLEKPISIWKKNKLIYETKSGKVAMYDTVKCKTSLMYDNNNRFWRHEENIYSQLKMEMEAGVLYGSSLVSMNA